MSLKTRWMRRVGRRFSGEQIRNNVIEFLEPRCVLTHWGSPAVPAFSSLSGANHTVYLDFNGHVTENTSWNSYFNNPSIDSPPYNIDTDASAFSATELARIEEAWKRVAEDFIPFNVNVTTVDPGIEALRKTSASDTQWGVRVVITADTEASGAGGIAYIDSFNWSSDTPVWVFNTSTIGVAEAASHEVGHSMGLSHDGTSTTSYYTGHGTDGSQTEWASIMGVGYYANITQWDRGEYFGSNNAGSGANYSKGPDDLAIITSYNGFGYRTDDHGGTSFTASPLSVSGASVSGSGIIERSTDADFFTFTTAAGNVTLNLAPFTPGPNIDIQADLYDAAGTLVASSNPATLLTASFSLNLAAGQYYLSVDGVGVGNPAISPPTGYSDYASIGRYSITGSIVDPGQLPQFSIGDVTVNESAGTATFTVTLTGTVVTPVTVDFGTANGTATAPADYGASSGTLTFTSSGASSQSIVVSIVDDATVESSETFFVNLSNAAGATLSDSQGQGTIQDNDVAPTISIVAVSASKNEGTSTSATPFTFTVSRTGSTSGTASAQYAVSGLGSSKNAAKADDFSTNVFPSGTVSFAAGEASKTLTILVKADSTKESNEKFRVTLSNSSGAALATTTADGTIVNDDGRLSGGAPAGGNLPDGSPRRASEINPVVTHTDALETLEESQSHYDGKSNASEVRAGIVQADEKDSNSAAVFGVWRPDSVDSPRTRSRSLEQPAPSLRGREFVKRHGESLNGESDKPADFRVEPAKSQPHASEASNGFVDEIFAAVIAWLEV